MPHGLLYRLHLSCLWWLYLFQHTKHGGEGYACFKKHEHIGSRAVFDLHMNILCDRMSSYNVLECKMCPDLGIKPSRCECRSAYEVLLHSSRSTLHQIIWAWSPCGTSGSSAGPNPPSLPVNPSGRRAPPTRGSWGRICGAQPWSCMLAARLKRPARTAARGGPAFCGHVSAAVYIQSITRPSLARIRASVDRSSRCQSTGGTQGVRGEGWGLQRRANV